MKKIFSKANPSVLLHQINRLEDALEERLDLSDPKEFLQVSLLKIDSNKATRPHKHLWRDGEKSVITQEGWIVIKGRIRCTFYDTDNSVIEEEVLNPGDCSITFRGGHSLVALDEGAVFYEMKTGPYKGRENDNETL